MFGGISIVASIYLVVSPKFYWADPTHNKEESCMQPFALLEWPQIKK